MCSILSLTYWICLIQGISLSEKSFRLRMFEYITIFAIWTFDTVATMSTFQSKGFGGIRTSVQLYTQAGLLTSISLTFVFYGIRILYHLSVIEKIDLAQRSLRAANMTKSTPFIDDYSDISDSGNSQMIPVLSTAMKKPSWRIYKVLIFTQSFALATVIGQVCSGCPCLHLADPYNTLSCICRFTLRTRDRQSHGKNYYAPTAPTAISKSMWNCCTASR